MGDLFTLPPDVDTQVSPLYQKKVRERQSRQFNNRIQDLDSWANSPSNGDASLPTAPKPSTPATSEKGYNTFAEMGKAVPLGVYDATKEMALTLHSIKNWASEKLYNATDGAFDLGYTDVAQGRKNVAAPESKGIPANLVRGISDFATGFYAGGQVLKGASYLAKGSKALTTISEFATKSPKLATAAKGMAKGAFADATAFDPHMERVSNLVEQYPALSNPISSYLAAKPGDSEAEGRFKNTLEGMGLGTAVEGLFLGVKYLKAGKSLKPSVKDAFEEALKGADEAVDGIKVEGTYVNLDDPSAVRVAKQQDVFQRIREEEALTSRIDAAESSARAEEQRLISYERGDQGLIEYKPNFTMVDTPEIKLPSGSIHLGEDLSHLAVHDHPRPPEVPRAVTIDSIIHEGIDYRPREVSGRVVEDAGVMPEISQGRRTGRETQNWLKDKEWKPKTGMSGVDEAASARLQDAANSGATVINYAKSLGHDSLDSFLKSISGFTKESVLHTLAGGSTGAVAGGATDLTGDGKVTFADVAAGFVMGAGLVTGGKAIAYKLAQGKTKTEAFKELTQEKAAELDAVISKVKGAMNSGTLDEKTMTKLQGHLDTLEALKVEVKKVKSGTVAEAIKDDTVRIKYKESERPIVTFKEDKVSLDNLQEAILKGDTTQVAEGLDVNFKYIDTEDDIKNYINLTAEKMGTPKDSVRSEEMVRQFADDLGYNEKSLQTMRNAEKDIAHFDSKLMATRGLLIKSAEELKLRAEAFKANPADDTLLLELRKQLVIHSGIQRSLSNTRTEVGRALKSFQYISDGLASVKDIEASIAQLGGKVKNAKIADHIIELMKNGEQRGLNGYARAVDGNPKLSALTSYYINSLLSSPSTWAVNALTNTMTTVLMPSERLMAGVLRGGQGTEIRQAQAMMVGIGEGFKDAWRMMSKSWAAGGEGILDPLIKVEGLHYNAISSEALGVAPEGVVGKALDFLGTVVINTPSRILGAGDEFFKTISARMSLNEQLFLKSVKEAEMKGLTGDELAKATADAMDNLKNNVPTSIMDALEGVSKDIHDAVISTARYNTFTENLNPALQGIQRAINEYPIAKLFVPFFKVPINIMKYAHERTPIINLWSRDIRESLTHSDPAIRAEAQAKLATGSMIYGTAAYLYSQGSITGRNVPIDGSKDSSANDLAGKPAYSIKIGDTWYSYNRLDPVGMMLGLATDAADILGHADEATSKDLTVAVMAAIAKNITSKTYLQGVSNLVEAIDSGSPQKMQNLLGSLVGAFAPSMGYSVAKMVDPVAKEATDLVDYFYRRTPGLSSELPSVKNIFGEDVRLKPGYGMDSMSPIYTSKETEDTVKKEFMRLGISSMHTMSDMKKIHGIELTPEQKARYIELMGQPLKKSLDRLVASPAYQRMSEGTRELPGGKETAISDEIKKWKSKARMKVLREFPEIKDAIKYNTRLAKEVKRPNSSSWLNQQIGD